MVSKGLRMKKNSEKWGPFAVSVLVASGIVLALYLAGTFGLMAPVSGWWVAVISAASAAACAVAVNEDPKEEGDEAFILGCLMSTVTFLIFLGAGLPCFF